MHVLFLFDRRTRYRTIRFRVLFSETINEDMRHKEFESIDAMTRENDNTSYSDVRVRDDGIFFKRFITDYYC